MRFPYVKDGRRLGQRVREGFEGYWRRSRWTELSCTVDFISRDHSERSSLPPSETEASVALSARRLAIHAFQWTTHTPTY